MALLRDYTFNDNLDDKGDKDSKFTDNGLTSLAINQKEALERLIKQNRNLNGHIQNIMNDFECRYCKLLGDFQIYKTQRQIEQGVLNNQSIKDLEEQKRLLQKVCSIF